MLLRAGWVVPVDRPPLRDAAVAVENGQVRWVGPAPDAPAGEARDLGAGVLLPGLVNAHCHLELSHLAGRLAGASGFVDWVERLVTMRPEDSMDTVRQRAAAGIQELEATGTVAVGDVSNALAHLDLLERLVAAGARVLRADRLGSGGGGAGVERRARTAGQPQPFRYGDGVAGRARAALRFARAATRDRRGRRRVRPAPGGVSARAPVPARPGRRSGAPSWPDAGWAMWRFVPPASEPGAATWTGSACCARAWWRRTACRWTRPIARCSPRAGCRSSCARAATARLDVGLAPVPELRAAGVRLAIGTDSLASVPSLDLWEDVLALHRAFPSLEPEWLVRTATQGGAEALGLPDLGRIAPGAEGAFAFAEGPRSMPDPLAFLLSGEARLRGVRA